MDGDIRRRRRTGEIEKETGKTRQGGKAGGERDREREAEREGQGEGGTEIIAWRKV